MPAPTMYPQAEPNSDLSALQLARRQRDWALGLCVEYAHLDEKGWTMNVEARGEMFATLRFLTKTAIEVNESEKTAS